MKEPNPNKLNHQQRVSRAGNLKAMRDECENPIEVPRDPGESNLSAYRRFQNSLAQPGD